MRIDAAAGFVLRDRFAYPWLGSAEHMQRDFTPEQLWRILSRNRFEGCVAASMAQEGGDVDWLMDLAVTELWVHGVLGTGGNPRRWDAWQKRGPLCGVLLCPAEFDAAREVAARGLACELAAHIGEIDQVLRLAEGMPESRMVLAHMGRPSFRAEDFKTWAAVMERLGRQSPVFVKISGLINEAGATGWKADWYRPWVQHLLEVFGPQRLMYGSDWPRCMRTGTWKESLAAFTQSIGAQPMEAREQLLGGTAARFYRLTATLTSLK